MGNRYIIQIVFVLVFFSCKEEMTENPFCDRYEEGEIIIGINEGVDIQTSFEFVNQYSFTIEQVSGNKYESSLPGDSLEYVIEYLNSKDYINHEGFKAVKGGSVYLHYETKVLTVTCNFWDMTLENQQDWITTKSILKFSDESSLRSFILNVPVGQEKKWVTVFKDAADIRYAELNCYVRIN